MNITVFIGSITVVLLLIFAIFSFKSGKNSKLSNFYLGFFLFSNFVFLLSFIAPDLGRFLNLDLAIVHQLGNPYCFLFGPFLYLFTLAITNNQHKFSIYYYLHLFPFVVFSILSFYPDSLLTTNFYMIFNIHVFLYLFICVRAILAYQKNIKSYFSSIEKINFEWLLYIVGAFIIMWFIDFLAYYLLKLGIINSSILDWTNFLSILINLTFIVILFFKALQEPQFLLASKVNSNDKYLGSNLSQELKKEQLKKLQDFFEENQPYLEPGLTISEVSDSIDISVKNLSQIINELLQKNFYDYTNSFRIDFAKKKLTDSNNEHLTIQEVFYDSGFNSKSAFNAAFKKHTHLTPTEFRRQKGVC